MFDSTLSRTVGTPTPSNAAITSTSLVPIERSLPQPPSTNVSEESNLFHLRFLQFLTSTSSSPSGLPSLPPTNTMNDSHQIRPSLSTPRPPRTLPPLSSTHPRAWFFLEPFWNTGAASNLEDSFNGESSLSDRENGRESENEGDVEDVNGQGSDHGESRTNLGWGSMEQRTARNTSTSYQRDVSEFRLRFPLDTDPSPVNRPATTAETNSLSGDAFVTLNAFEFLNRFANTNTSSSMPGRFPWLFAHANDSRNRGSSTSRRRGSGDTRQPFRLRNMIRTQPRRDPSAPIWTTRPSLSPSPSPYSNPNRILKMTETEPSEGWTGFGCREYPLMFEVMENDAGEFSSAYKVQNILQHDDSVFCSARRGTVVNIQLRFVGTSTSSEQIQQHHSSEGQEPCKVTTTPPPFLLTKMIIKAPGRGFTAPCSEGLIFISHTPILNSSTQQYDQWTWADYETYLEKPESLTSTSDCSDHKSEDVDGIRPAGYFRLDSDSNWTQQIRFGTGRTGRDMSVGMGKRKTREETESSELQQPSSSIDELQISEKAEDDSSVLTNEIGFVSHLKSTHTRPHPYHRSSHEKSPHLHPNFVHTNLDRTSTCSARNIRNIPYPSLNNGGIGNVSGRSGKYILLKLLRADGRVGAENIDLQWVGFSGFVGGQPFSYGAVN